MNRELSIVCKIMKGSNTVIANIDGINQQSSVRQSDIEVVNHCKPFIADNSKIKFIQCETRISFL